MFFNIKKQEKMPFGIKSIEKQIRLQSSVHIVGRRSSSEDVQENQSPQRAESTRAPSVTGDGKGGTKEVPFRPHGAA